MASILFVDDEPAIGLILQDTLERAGHHAIGAQNVPEALQVLARGGVDLIISDYRMPGLTGLEFLSVLARDGYDIPLIMLTGYGSIEHAVASIKAGAIDYITKPVRPQQLELAVDQALQFVKLRRENESLRREVMEFRNERQIIGDSTAIRRIIGRTLSAKGYRVVEAADGRAALDSCRSDRPDLVLLDIDMPVMDGTTALKAMRDDEELHPPGAVPHGANGGRGSGRRPRARRPGLPAQAVRARRAHRSGRDGTADEGPQR